MKRRIAIVSVFSLLAALAFNAVPSASAFVSGPGPSANGHGNLTVGGELRTFTFHGSTRPNGTVTGSVTLHNRVSDTFIHADVNCMVVSGNTAMMSGPITKSSNETLEGLTGVFRVVDNGEGDNSPADQLSLFAIFAANSTANCRSNINLQMFNSEAGNIQVKP